MNKNKNIVIFQVILIFTLIGAIFVSWLKVEMLAGIVKNDSMINTFSGAAIIILLTSGVLVAQMIVQARESKKQEIFKEKMKLYKVIIDTYALIKKNGVFGDAEKNNLKFLTDKVALLSNLSTLNAFVEFTSKLYDNTDEEGNLSDETNDKGELIDIFLPFIKAAREDLEVQSVIEGNVTKTFTEIQNVERKKYQKSSYTDFDSWKHKNTHLNKHKDDEDWYNSRTKLIEAIHRYIIDNCEDIDGLTNYSNRQINFGAKYSDKKRKSFCIVEVNVKSHIRLLYQLDHKLDFKKPVADELGAERQSERYGVLEIKNLDDFNEISGLVLRSYEIVKNGEPLYTDSKKKY